MFHKLLFMKGIRLNIIGFAYLLCLSAPITVYAQPRAINTSDKTFLTMEKGSTPYRNLLTQSGKEFLWLEPGGLTLSGLTLHRLLADLGGHAITSISDLTIDNYRQHDRILTRGFLELLRIDADHYNLFSATAEDALIAAIRTDSTDQLLLSLIPKQAQITQLRKALARYRMLSRYPWPVLDLNFKPKLGQSHPQVKGLREILTLLGDMPHKAQSKHRLAVFDAVVVGALKKFQRRHGLAADGKLGPETYAALQVPPQQRIKQLQANLWRCFMLPRRPPEKYLLVNLPSYQLSVMEAGRQVLQMKVIVGDSNNPTPQLITQIESLTLNPSWTPTVNITENELIPQYRKDYLSLKRNNFQLIKGTGKNLKRREIDVPDLNLSKLLQSYRLVQAPGDNNALGSYRFNIPNSHSVYLHDTPDKSLFKQPQRALSHGCVRLENAALLAKYLLRFEAFYDEKQMLSVLKSGKTSNLSLTKPLPVYITYQTAWIDKQGELRFSADIYSLDKQNPSLAQFQTIVSNSVITHSDNPL